MRQPRIEMRGMRQLSSIAQRGIEGFARPGLRALVGDGPQVVGKARDEGFIHGRFVGDDKSERKFKHNEWRC